MADRHSSAKRLREAERRYDRQLQQVQRQKKSTTEQLIKAGAIKSQLPADKPRQP